MVSFSYKNGHGVHGCHTYIEALKRRTALATGKWLQVISNMLFKTVILLRN